MKYYFLCMNLQETKEYSVNFLDISCTKYYAHRTEHVGNRDRISFTPSNKACFNLYPISQKAKLLNGIVRKCFFLEYYPSRKKVYKMRANTLTFINKVCLSLNPFSRSSKVLNDTAWSSATLNFTKIGKDM